MTAIEPFQVLASAGVITDRGLTLPPNITKERYEALCVALGVMAQAQPFLIGDALLDGEKLFGQEAFELAEAMNLTPDQKAQYMRVSERVPQSRRYDLSVLSWSHHRIVAPLDAKDQVRWLKRAAKDGLTTAELGKELRLELGPATVGRGAVEPVIEPATIPLEDAAREVYMSADFDNGKASVPEPTMRDLGKALGHG